MILAVHTGLRRTELITLSWSRVDLENRIIVFPVASRKNGRAHSVELSDGAYQALLEILEILGRANGASGHADVGLL